MKLLYRTRHRCQVIELRVPCISLFLALNYCQETLIIKHSNGGHIWIHFFGWWEKFLSRKSENIWRWVRQSGNFGYWTKKNFCCRVKKESNFIQEYKTHLHKYKRTWNNYKAWTRAPKVTAFRNLSSLGSIYNTFSIQYKGTWNNCDCNIAKWITVTVLEVWHRWGRQEGNIRL